MNRESITRSPAFTGLFGIAGKSVAGYGWHHGGCFREYELGAVGSWSAKMNCGGQNT